MMSASELRMHVNNGTDSHFFDRSSMRFFGDRMSNYGVCSQPVRVVTGSGGIYECWELYRRHPVKHGLQNSAYFDTVTYERRLPSNG